MPSILVITANSNMPPLQLAAEVRNIRDALGEHSNFTVRHETEARAADLIRRLRDERPDILHIAGHGLGPLEQAISLTRDDGQQAVLTMTDLSSILQNIPIRPRLVILNACFSAELASAITQCVAVVVGAHGSIGDETARRFAGSLYAGLGQSQSVKESFELARVELRVSGHDSEQVVLQCGPKIDPLKVVFYARPELLAKFELSPKGKPEIEDGHYSIQLWLRGVDQHVDSVTFQVCHESFEEPFWEVRRADSADFLTDDFSSRGDVTLRATAWSRDRGVGIETTLSAALQRHYGNRTKGEIGQAIQSIAHA